MLAMGVALMTLPLLAAPEAPGDIHEMRKWAVAVGLRPTAPSPDAKIDVVANNDSVTRRGRTMGPLRMGERTFRHGLFCHALSRLVVTLPGPAQRFDAAIGVDTNEQTMGRRGTVVFVVEAGGKEVFRSRVMREGDAPVELSVDAGGAAELVLIVEDAGDGISCDQADWADARVALADGRVLWLDDLPLDGAQRPVYSEGLPFSFTYGGRASGELLPTWSHSVEEAPLDEQRTQRTHTWRDPETGLVVRCAAIEYADFPVIEWTVHFGNTGAADTPILEDVQALDTTISRWSWPDFEPAEFFLHHFTGSPCTARDFEPHVTRLGKGVSWRKTAARGRPTSEDMCYFNLEWPMEGMIVGLGWPGQWAAEFARDDGTAVRLRAGQELTHLTLRPGETARTPLVAMLFYGGDWLTGQNIWRRWMVAHNIPRPGGKPLAPQWHGNSSLWFAEMTQATDAGQIGFIDRYLDNGLKIDYWWMDAGWYRCNGWPNTGTWEVDTGRFPNGLRAVTDHAHARGVRCIVWFEPERVTPGTWLYENHPEWLLGPDGGQKLLNLGTPEARQWLTDHVDRLLVEQGIDLYRQDFNMDPLDYWRANDAEDRQGITEMRHVEGYLAHFDELRRRHPDMLLDTCASGGRRDDLETLRRAVPLHRSDYLFEPVSQQCHTYGLALWVPYFAIGTFTEDPYVFRSMLCPAITTGWDMRREDVDFDRIRALMEDWRTVAPYMLGDYYPLTPYSADPGNWMAWQFHREDLGGGIVQAFRRVDSVYEVARFRLLGLSAESRYEVRDVDTNEVATQTGRELMDTGVPVRIDRRPGAVILAYHRTE